MPKVPLDVVEKTIACTYRSLWTTVFGSPPGLTPANIELILGATHAGYRHEHGILVLSVSFHDLADPGILNTGRDPQWFSDLAHEMVHEYQMKVVLGHETPEGRSLRRMYRDVFSQPGHDADFFTAVPILAYAVGKPIDEFIAWISPSL